MPPAPGSEALEHGSVDDMDWTFPADAGEPGMVEIGRRLAETLGRLPDATRFTYDPRDMLRATRLIEAASRGGTLLVGFQTNAKLERERERYQELIAAGTRITAYATGPCPSGLDGIEYREQAPDVHRLANQWFLVSDAPEPVAFVSWELGDAASFGVGGAATPGKRFVGFVSDDPAVIEELLAALRRVPGLKPPTPAPQPMPGDGSETGAVLEQVARLDPPPSGAGDGAVVVPIGRGSDRTHALALALAIATREHRRLVVVDRGAEGLFTSPYSAFRSDDADQPVPDRLFDAAIARKEGRGESVAALEAAEALGVEAGGWFPTEAGMDGLGAAVTRFGGGLLVLPGSIRRPSIAERLRGMRPERLVDLGTPHVIAE